MHRTSVADEAPPRRTPQLLLLVYAASLMLAVVTAGALALVVSDELTKTAISATVEADTGLVLSVLEGRVREGDMAMAGVTDSRVAEIQDLLATLTARSGILRIKVHGTDGTVLFSDQPGLRGKQFEISDELGEAIEGEPSVEIIREFDGEEEDLVGLGAASALEEYLPITSESTNDGRVVAVFEVYRDADALLARIDDTVRMVVVVTAAATAVLAILLFLIFRAAQSRLSRQAHELVEATRRDALTGLLNHGTVVGQIASWLDESRSRARGGVAVAVVDIDNFRLLNDTHGHAAGDRALREVAGVLRQVVPERALIGRLGPDEFVIATPPSSAHELEPAVERLRDALVDLSLQFGSSERLPVTVSVGIADAPRHGDSDAELLAAAARALGEAKASGGNAVRLAEAIVDETDGRARSRFDVLAGLVIAVDTKDRYTKQHSEDVARYALFLSERIGIDAEARQAIRMAGLLHDVGKIGIPDAILRKPAALTPDEYDIVKQHVALGDLIVRDIPDIEVVRAGIRHHHERWDGGGYLDGLSGEVIPLVARILAIADAFSAMTSTRPYRRALPLREALRRLEDAASTQLDPKLVPVFVSGIETASDAPLPGDGRPLRRLWTPDADVA